MILKREVIRRQREAGARFERNRRIIPAVIKSVDGSVHPSGRGDMVWVAEYGLDTNRVAVLNSVGITTAETPVLIGTSPKAPYRRQVIGLYTGDLTPVQQTSITLYSFGAHAQNHQYPSEASPGEDPVLVYQPAVQPFKTKANGTSLTVTVQPLIYQRNGVRKTWAGESKDLTAFVPSTSGNTVRILLYLETETNTLEVLEGSEIGAGGGTPVDWPTCPAGGIPSAYIQLTNGDTSIAATGVDDARYLLYGRTVESPYSATEIGQVVYSPDGLSFAPHTPLTYADGWMVNGDGVLLVTG